MLLRLAGPVVALGKPRELDVRGELTEEGLRLRVPEGEAFVPRLFQHLSVGVSNVAMHRPSLDDVFIKYTGRDIRDAEAGHGDRFKMNPMVRGWRKEGS